MSRSGTEAQLGALVEGSYADVILVDENPLETVKVRADYENSIEFVMKGGQVFRDGL